jgi:hypothetical protein
MGHALGETRPRQPYHATLLQAAGVHQTPVPRGYPVRHPRRAGPRVSTKAQLHADWHLGANVDPQSLRDGTRSCIYYTGPWPRDFHLK